ncbi:unnamed protein product [Caenorhabditis auriculariae]|uniref:C2H2-type domain-containing protein n=1 Tax=Caenorhabditis auriculariae TaxID=2777116 RepID=A0A8S1H7U8_9PELO|nr:unnamed protein product [Caenorhabditis auriculariae]
MDSPPGSSTEKPFKLFRPWEDDPVVQPMFLAIPVFWDFTNILPSISPPNSIYSNYATPIFSSGSSASSPLSSATEENKPRRKCQRCTCPNCKGRKQGSRSVDYVHICDFEGCTKTYKKTSHLMAHKRSHIGCRPYACDHPSCERAFSRSDQLLRHKRSHTGLKNHRCAECGQTFGRSDHMKQHLQTQHSKNVFK